MPLVEVLEMLLDPGRRELGYGNSDCKRRLQRSWENEEDMKMKTGREKRHEMLSNAKGHPGEKLGIA